MIIDTCKGAGIGAVVLRWRILGFASRTVHYASLNTIVLLNLCLFIRAFHAYACEWVFCPLIQ